MPDMVQPPLTECMAPVSVCAGFKAGTEHAAKLPAYR